ncbi:site-specific integrase [Streptomyces sp. NPDC056987]|uniref:site-specific integrase n=1 Tax=Streptomyces sp. NPDC056987 TaxID=3345988 RepID=UPI00362A3B0D
MGLRPAEVCGLRWEDVDLDNATIAIANTRTMMGNRYVVEKDTKSMAGERELPLPTPVLSALKAFKALQAREKLIAGEAYAGSGYVLVHETGEAFTIKQLRRRAYRLMEILGLRRVRIYDARSSCFTYLANKGVPDHILARWAGHTNVKTTNRRRGSEARRLVVDGSCKQEAAWLRLSSLLGESQFAPRVVRRPLVGEMSEGSEVSDAEPGGAAACCT